MASGPRVDREDNIYANLWYYHLGVPTIPTLERLRQAGVSWGTSSEVVPLIREIPLPYVGTIEVNGGEGP